MARRSAGLHPASGETETLSDSKPVENRRSFCESSVRMRPIQTPRRRFRD